MFKFLQKKPNTNIAPATNPAGGVAVAPPPTSPLPKKKLSQKQIPTLIGLGVLVVALVIGVMFFGQGTGVFAPRATPQTTPKNVRLTNVSDTSFTVSFLTDESTVGFVKYGEELSQLKSQSSDDRDQLSGTVSDFTLHHITVRGLNPGATYYYTLGTGTRASYDNNGTPFTVTTARRSGAPSAAKTVYGSVLNQSGSPAEGSIVYLSIPGIGDMSSLVKNSGSWAIPLSNARTADGSQYAAVQDEDTMALTVQGPSAALTSKVSLSVADSQPVPNITLGQNSLANTPDLGDEVASLKEDSEASDSADAGIVVTEIESGQAASATSRATGGLSSLVTSNTAAIDDIITLDLETPTASPTLETTQPKIVGKASPQVRVNIVVNSETQITQEVVSDASGNFELDIAALQKQLEPGEHTVTYTYIDPTTGEEITKTQTFYVSADAQDTSTLLAQANTSTTNSTTTSQKNTTTSSSTATKSATPFGSGNPFPIGGLSTSSASTSTRSTKPATTAAVPVSGSVSATYTLIFGGLFFIIAGLWSFWLAQEWDEVRG